LPAKRGFISALDVIHAIDGPLAITSCTTHKGNCQQTQTCNVKRAAAQSE